MKFCAIICEYNPFHNGHLHQLQESLKISGCDGILCIMGGNFSQRGEPTITNKLIRAKMAIVSGATAVVQIPTYFCTANAEVFANAAVKIATSFENVTHISFGSECGDIQSLAELAKFLNHEPKFYKEKIKRNLEEGYSLGRAKTHALQECISSGLAKFSKPEIIHTLLDSPNNILAVEYLRVLLTQQNTNITPITVKRVDNANDVDFINDYRFSTASAIRDSINQSKHIWNIRKYIPAEAYKVFSHSLQTYGIPNLELWGNLIMYKLACTSPAELRLNYDVVEGIENKLIATARENVDWASCLELCVSRRFTKSRIQRISTACLLSLKDEYTKDIYSLDFLPYIRLLACKQEKEVLSSLKMCRSVLITRKQDAVIAQQDSYAKILMFAEDKANALYSRLLTLNKDQQKEFAISDIYTKTEFM